MIIFYCVDLDGEPDQESYDANYTNYDDALKRCIYLNHNTKTKKKFYIKRGYRNDRGKE